MLLGLRSCRHQEVPCSPGQASQLQVSPSPAPALNGHYPPVPSGPSPTPGLLSQPCLGSGLFQIATIVSGLCLHRSVDVGRYVSRSPIRSGRDVCRIVCYQRKSKIARQLSGKLACRQ